MSRTKLRQFIGLALVDREFCDGLMDGKRSTLLSESELTGEERALIASSETDSVKELASSVHSWLKEQGSAVPSRIDCDAAHAL